MEKIGLTCSKCKHYWQYTSKHLQDTGVCRVCEPKDESATDGLPEPEKTVLNPFSPLNKPSETKGCTTEEAKEEFSGILRPDPNMPESSLVNEPGTSHGSKSRTEDDLFINREEGLRRLPESNPVFLPGGYAEPEIQYGHPEFHRIVEEMRALHAKKAADYGLGTDVLANCRGSVDFGIPAWIGVVMRMNDKMTRLKSFAQKGSLQNESVEDSLLDTACYAILALILYREQSNESSGN